MLKQRYTCVLNRICEQWFKKSIYFVNLYQRMNNLDLTMRVFVKAIGFI